ncbi:hypothetical protein [Bradyrhizobium genomosp. III]|uniref:hypothetical protein n=1 Tax=Bradyrhizobium genomosp. III TaxID=2683271 RepID=UPI0012F4BC19|nr:hypothetical protein [Bradyrhizobium sp. CCBAU 15544]
MKHVASPLIAMPVSSIEALNKALADLPAVVPLQRAKSISRLLESANEAVCLALPSTECGPAHSVDEVRAARIGRAHRGLVCACRHRWPRATTAAA